VATIAAPTITRPSFQEPDCYDHFSQSLPNTDLCRPSLALGGVQGAEIVQQHPAKSSSSFDCHASQLRKVRPASGEILVQHENPALPVG
jgi:hypothetical protein